MAHEHATVDEGMRGPRRLAERAAASAGLRMAPRIALCALVAAGAATAAEPAAGAPPDWQNVSAAFTQQIQADHIEPAYLCRCQGMAVAPSGEIVIQTATKGICVSRDQGSTWSQVSGSTILGRCEHGFACSVAYPYDGRMAFFCYDGNGGSSGGMTLDGAATWRPFLSQVARGTEFGDVDWSVHDPTTIYAVTHEPYFDVVSTDAGQHWLRLAPIDARVCIGVISGQRFVRYDPADRGGAIQLSQDAGRTWATVDRGFHVQGRHTVRFGDRVYWTTAQGVITSRDGATWTLTGPGASGALYGPYFGSSEREFVVVTNRSFLKTSDGGATWTPIADVFQPPDLFHGSRAYIFFGWDAAHGVLYASGIAAAVYRHKL